MPSEPPSALLDRVRKLLAKAEAEGVTPPEAEALTAKAAELMARYGIDRARLAAARPDTDRPGSRVIDIDNPWAQVRAHLLAGLAGAMRCQCVLLQHERAGRAHPRVRLRVGPGAGRHPVHLAAAADGARADRRRRPGRGPQRTGVAAQLAARLRHRRHRPRPRPRRSAPPSSVEGEPTSGPSTALVLADRAVVIRHQVEQAYPVTRKTRITYSGRGYSAGYAQGQRADIGNARLGQSKALNRA